MVDPADLPKVGGIKGFFIDVMTSPQVEAMFSRLIKEVMAGETEVLHEGIQDTKQAVQELEDKAIRNFDAMDGQMGNLNEQVNKMPGEMIEGIINGVVKGIANAPGEILGGFFGQR